MDRGQIVRRGVEVLGWILVGAVGLVMLTQAVGWNGSRLVATLQSLTPYATVLVLAISALAVWQRRTSMASVGALVGVGAFVLSIPLVIPPDQAAPRSDAVGVSVASVNLLFSNPIVDAAANVLVDVDADVIVFIEYTIEHRNTLAAHPLAQHYPHRIERNGSDDVGIAMWSKFPADENDRPVYVDDTIDASLDGPDGRLRVLSVHPPTPIHDFPGWKNHLELIGQVADDIAEPMLIIGDFNATYWHPVFRDLLDTDLTDAHIANGEGWSTSWPTDRIFPPFVRLDHALTGSGLVSTDVDDFHVPGSDHAGLVVEVSPAD